MVFTPRNLDWWCERGILMLVLAVVIFAPLAFGAVYIWTFLVVEALVAGVAVLWLARLWGGHKPKILWPPLAWAVAAFVLYAVARYFTADVEYVARQEMTRVLLYAFLFLAVVSNLYRQEAAETVVYTLTAVAALASSYALIQFLHHSNQVWDLKSPYVTRASGTYINPDHFAGFLELVLPLPLAFLMAGRVGVIARVLLAYATLTIMAGLAVTLSRGGYVAAAAGILLLLGFLLCHRNHSLRALVVLLVMLGAGGFFAAHFLSTNVGYSRRIMHAAENPGEMNTDARLQMWTAAAQMWRGHPWWGVGPGLFDEHFREFRPAPFQQDPEHAHNDYVEILADWGLAGGLIVLSGIGIFIIGLVKSWPHVRRDENDFGSGMSSRYAFFLGAVSGLFALAVHSLIDFNLHVAANALVGVVVLGLVASNLRFATKRYWLRARWPVQSGLTLVLAGFMVYVALQAWRSAGEELWTKRAEGVPMSPSYLMDQAALLEKALAFEPNNAHTAYLIGECYRRESWDGGEDCANQAQIALKFYAMGIRANPYDNGDYCHLQSGMCLDWLGRHAEAEPYFAAAERLDPNGQFVTAKIGLHYVAIGDYAAARQWFFRACKLSVWKDETARSYLLEICQPKLVQKASGQLPMRFYYNGKDN